MTTHPRAALASLQLGRPVQEFLAEQRANNLSYRKIAAALRDATDGATDVSDQTIQAWFRAFDIPTEQSA